MTRFFLMIILAVAAVSCGRGPMPVPANDATCIGLADDLKTLRVGDELPRVVQVMGMPEKTLRISRLFGGPIDVMEYKIAKGVCARSILHVNERLYLIFDGKGRYVRAAENAPTGFFNGGVYGYQPMVIDPVVLRP